MSADPRTLATALGHQQLRAEVSEACEFRVKYSSGGLQANTNIDWFCQIVATASELRNCVCVCVCVDVVRLF